MSQQDNGYCEALPDGAIACSAHAGATAISTVKGYAGELERDEHFFSTLIFQPDGYAGADATFEKAIQTLVPRWDANR